MVRHFKVSFGILYVAQVFDFIETDSYQAIVMEYLAGGSLETYVKRMGGQLEVADVLKVGIRVANALAHSHEQGIIHRHKAGKFDACRARTYRYDTVD